MQQTRPGADPGRRRELRGHASIRSGALALWCSLLGTVTTVQAQQSSFRMGLLVPASSHTPPLPSINALLQRLEDLGYGRNLAVERRFSDERPSVKLKTAKALGLTIPQAVLIRADGVIE